MAKKSAQQPRSPSPAGVSASAVASSTKPSSASSSTSGTSSSLKPTAQTPATSAKTKSAPPKTPQNAQEIVLSIWEQYLRDTPQRVKLVDAFMGFLVVVGAVQFVYCCLVGNYPFNAFLSGFSATVGQFVLTASLRIQTNPANRHEFRSVSDERAFADYVLGSLVLHFFCVNFIN